MEPGEDNEEGSPTKEEDVMKKIGEYSCKGTVDDIEGGASVRINLFDGKFDTAYKVVNFQVWPVNMTDYQEEICYGRLCTEDLVMVNANFFRASENRQIGWAVSSTDNAPNAASWKVLDEENLIVEDLFVQMLSANEQPANYLIKLEKYDISDWQGALAMVRNKSQG